MGPGWGGQYWVQEDEGGVNLYGGPSSFMATICSARDGSTLQQPSRVPQSTGPAGYESSAYIEENRRKSIMHVCLVTQYAEIMERNKLGMHYRTVQ